VIYFFIKDIFEIIKSRRSIRK